MNKRVRFIVFITCTCVLLLIDAASLGFLLSDGAKSTEILAIIDRENLTNEEMLALKRDMLMENAQLTTLIAAIDAVGSVLLVIAFFVLWRAVRRREDALESTVQARTKALEWERRRAESESRSKSEFLARMSHELRTPLNAVIGFAELIAQSRDPKMMKRHAAYADDIRGAGLHLKSLVDDLLELGRIEAGETPLILETESAKDLITRAVILAGATNDPRITVEVETDLGLIADRRATLQIILNLVQNARRYAGPDAHIRVGADARRGDVVLYVADDGVGMEPQELASALSPYKTGRDPYVASDEGYGLGLPIVYSLARAQDAPMEVMTAPGEGFMATIAFRAG